MTGTWKEEETWAKPGLFPEALSTLQVGKALAHSDSLFNVAVVTPEEGDTDRAGDGVTQFPRVLSDPPRGRLLRCEAQAVTC